MFGQWNWNKAELNVHNAEFLGAAAKLAYSEAADVQARLTEQGMELVQFFDRNDTQAFLARNNDACVLAFRGTEPDEVVDESQVCSLKY